MHIQRVKLRNWRNIQALDLPFKPGINLIYGPNETGKSTIIEAIRMGLTGNAAGGGKEYRQMTPWGSNAKATVEMDLQTTDHTLYRIRKSFPKGDAGLTIPAKNDLQLASGPVDTQETLNRILGINNELYSLWNLLFVKQGEVLDIIDRDHKKNPLDKVLKLHIEEILRETAQRELNQFQQILEQRLSAIFTPTGKLTTKSDYYKLLTAEMESNDKLDQLRELERDYLHNVKTLEENDLRRKDLEHTLQEHTLLLRQLELKHEAAAALEKEELIHRPLQERHERLATIGEKIRVLQQELPQLLGRRQRRLEDLAASIEAAKEKQTQAVERLERLRVKKAKATIRDTNRRALDKLENHHQEIRAFQKEIETRQTALPALLAAARTSLKQDLTAIDSRLEAGVRLAREIEETKTQIQQKPLITPREMDEIRGMTARLAKQKGTLEAAASGLELNLRVEPAGPAPLALVIRKDKSAGEPVSISQPLNISDFSRLELEDPGRLKLQFSGSLKDLDLPEVEEQTTQLEAELKNVFQRFGVEDMNRLEAHYQNATQRNQHLDGLLRQSREMEAPEILAQQKSKITERLNQIETLQQSYPLNLFNAGEETATQQDPVQEALLVSSRVDELNNRLRESLQGTSLQQMELALRRLQEDVEVDERHLAILEPRDIPNVEERHLEDQIELKNHLQRELDRLADQKVLLEDMPLPTDITPNVSAVDTPETASSQDLRSQIEQARQQLQSLASEKQRLLDRDTEESLSREFLAAGARVDSLKQKHRQMPPLDAGSAEEIALRKQQAAQTIDTLNRQLKETENQQHRLLGELGGFSANTRLKAREEDRHRQLLREIRRNLADIAADRLLLELIHREKERMQTDLFAPIQKRINNGFRGIVGDRYQVTVHEDLTLDIQARVRDGELQSDIRDSISFGTREQLSFMFRLAIAGQLSKREPQVMILDDSFVNTDRRRLGQIIDIIHGQRERLQFLIFTCRENDYDRYRDTFHCIDLPAVLASSPVD